MPVTYAGVTTFIGLAVKVSASRAAEPGFDSRLRQDFTGSGRTSDLKIGIPVAALPGTCCYWVSLGLVGLVSVNCDWAR